MILPIIYRDSDGGKLRLMFNSTSRMDLSRISQSDFSQCQSLDQFAEFVIAMVKCIGRPDSITLSHPVLCLDIFKRLGVQVSYNICTKVYLLLPRLIPQENSAQLTQFTQHSSPLTLLARLFRLCICYNNHLELYVPIPNVSGGHVRAIHYAGLQSSKEIIVLTLLPRNNTIYIYTIPTEEATELIKYFDRDRFISNSIESPDSHDISVDEILRAYQLVQIVYYSSNPNLFNVYECYYSSTRQVHREFTGYISVTNALEILDIKKN